MKKEITITPVIILLTFLCIFPVFVLGVTQWQATIDSSSSIKTTPFLLILTNSTPDKSSEIKTIVWGNLYPGSYTTYKLWLYNDHPQQSITLHLSTANWFPAEASNFMTLTWEHENYKLVPQTSVYITLTLTTSPDTINITNYNFQIIITGTSSET